MKTNSSARHLLKIRDIMLAVLLATALGLEIYLGAFLAARSGHPTAVQTDSPAAPGVGISDLIAGVR
jgi:hypothetical protein